MISVTTMNVQNDYEKIKNLLIFFGMINAPVVALLLSALFTSYILPNQSGNTSKIYSNLGTIIVRMVDPTKREIHGAEQIYFIK